MADKRLLMLAVAIACVFPATRALAAGPVPVKVHVFTAPTPGFGDAARQARHDAVKYVMSRIEKFYKTSLAIAEEEEALITLEIAAVDLVTTIDTETTRNLVTS